MNTLSAIKTIYAFEDGDNITPGMGVSIENGYGLQQYFNPSTGQVTETDFTRHPAILYPQAYSSRKGAIIVPETAGQMWYYNNISPTGAILDDSGNVKTVYADRFEKTTITVNGMTFPALKIKGNLATAADHTDKYIYYSSSYEGKAFTCQKHIPIQSAVGDAYSILLSVEGPDGTGDNVLSGDRDWVKHTAYLQLAGVNVAGTHTFTFKKLVNGVWTTIQNAGGLTELTANSLKVWDPAVEGVEMFQVSITVGDRTYTEVFEVTDIHDPFFIDDGCNIAGDTIKAGETATFNPKVCERETGNVVPGWSFSYDLTKRSDGTVINNFGVAALTYDNIRNVGGVRVRIKAEKN